jgi:aminopeptidase N
MIRRIVLFCLAVAAVACGQTPEGIPRQLARERAANISDVHYQLGFTLAPKASDVSGVALITFTLGKAQETLLDYRDGSLNGLTINGKAAGQGAIENGHIVLVANSLVVGRNQVEIHFTSHVAAAGKPIIRYEDKDDGSEYIYTLFVPMDASMAFPCFDQPDIKGRFQLTIDTETDWEVVSNTRMESYEQIGRAKHTQFVETQPISTYLLAFAAGPFQKIEKPGMPTVYFRKSQAVRAAQEVPELQEITARGIKFLSDYFAQPFPFPKYDMVLLPGMAYGGMEHAGATFLREEAVLFRTATTHSDILGRDILTLHELTHQWFGDLTTMRWFDDLWLKEGFAQFMAYRALSELKPDDNIWKRFYESIKPGAYSIDETKGTTPIYQDIPNLKDAKSAYGAIVYSKAPGVLKQLWFVLGDDHFRDGLRTYLKEHAYANAGWSDLVKAFEGASGRSLTKFADAYIRRRGMPQVDVAWSCAGGKLAHLTLSQKDVLGERGVWPIATQVLLSYRVRAELLRVVFDTSSVEVKDATGKPCPDYVLGNSQDYAYGRFLLDAKSQSRVMDELARWRLFSVTPMLMEGAFLRAMLWGSLWEAVRTANLSPTDYLSMSSSDTSEPANPLRDENDETLLASLISHSVTALHRYVSESDRHRLSPPLDELAATQMQQSTDQSLRIIWFRGMRALSESEQSRTRLKQLLDGTLAVPGITLRPLDRWNLVTTLVALNDPDADKVLTKEKERDHSGDGLKYDYVAEAARPDTANKKKYFDDYMTNLERPEDWVESSLGAFNYWNHSELTFRYLLASLEALPQVKRERKIFFLVAWLNAFIGGQQSWTAAGIVHTYLDNREIEPDTRLKILQVVDELDKTVKIRAKFVGGAESKSN